MSAIIIENLGKRYRRYDENRAQTFIEALSTGFRRMRPTDFEWALRDVSFTVPFGSLVAVIGRNGAGKSTLLRLAGQVGYPDEGTIAIQGRVGALLELGAGFHPELTGRENVYISGVIAGLTRAEIDKKFHLIVDFAELESYIDSPIRTYSTGMQMRLAFSIAVHSSPDVLLVDEVLAVGDYAFQQKCLQKIETLRLQGCAILLVTHDLSFAQTNCEQTIWLDNGHVVQQGQSREVVKAYLTEMQEHAPRLDDNDTLSKSGKFESKRIGNGDVLIESVRFCDATGADCSILSPGQSLTISVAYKARIPTKDLLFSISISDGSIEYCQFNTSNAGNQIAQFSSEGQLNLEIERLDLMAGEYLVNVGVFGADWSPAFDYHWAKYTIQILGEAESAVGFRPPYRWIQNKNTRPESQLSDHFV